MHVLTKKIVTAMLLGMALGLAINFFGLSEKIAQVIVEDILHTGGIIFINLLKLLIVPVVFVSLVCGSASINVHKIGRIGGKALILYLTTTSIAIALALIFANLFEIGKGMNIATQQYTVNYTPPSLKHIIISVIPQNLFMSLSQGYMLQIIFFALLFGIAISSTKKYGAQIMSFFSALNEVIIKLVMMVIKLTPYGVFCLITVLFAQLGFALLKQLMGYFSLVIFVLMLQLLIVYPLLLMLFARLHPIIFFRKMFDVMLFAFSVSSSAASIPLVLRAVENRLGVKRTIASFIVPLGATVNMDGTAIMQGIATVFIAHVYQVPLSFTSYLVIIAMATLASIGTAGIPSVGLITLAMVLKQVGLPIEGIALIIGVDRLLDMTRTAVNISGDSVIACIIAKSEESLDKRIYYGYR